MPETIEVVEPEKLETEDLFPELSACRKVGRIIENLNPKQQRIVLAWLTARYGLSV